MTRSQQPETSLLQAKVSAKIHSPFSTESPTSQPVIQPANKLIPCLSAFYNGHGWRAYESYIGSSIFYQGYSKRIKKMLLSSDRGIYNKARSI